MVQSDQPLPLGCVVELESATGKDLGLRSEVDGNGYFTVDGVPTGQYWIRVTDMQGNAVHTEYASISPSMSNVVIRLPKESRERPVSGTISVQRLQHKVPSKARKEFEKAVRAEKRQDMKAAIKHLQNAIKADPEYMEAHNNLGARYLVLGEPQKAMVEFQRAIDLDPHSALPYVNIATALLLLKRAPEAEKAARQAVDLDSLNPRARYMLGLALINQDKYTSEALFNLRRATDRYPRAHLAAAEVLMRGGHFDDARSQLQTYLASGDERGRDEVQKWLAQLKAARR